MPNKIDLDFAFGIPPKQAAAYFESKGYKIAWNWEETSTEAHAKAFTVAKAMQADILETIRSQVDRAIKEGKTLPEFQKTLEPVLKIAGWWGKQEQVNPNTGETEIVQLGSPHRLATIYRTNLQTAMMAGRYQELTANADNRPYWQYIAVMDKKTRPTHAAMNDRVFLYDDPIWSTHLPPLGFRCRCRIRALSEKRLQSKGLEVENSGNKLEQTDRLVSERSGMVEPSAIFKTSYNDQKVNVAPDAGWGGDRRAAWMPDLEKYDYQVARRFVDASLQGSSFKAFFSGITGGNFPVAVLRPEDKKLLDSQVQTVLLSQESLQAHIKKHPEITIKDYQKIPQILDDGDVYQQSDERLVYLKFDNILYRAAMKKTKDGLENYFLTLFKIEESKAQKEVRDKMQKIR